VIQADVLYAGGVRSEMRNRRFSMIDKAALSLHERSDVHAMKRVGRLAGILAVLVPFVLVAGIGEWLGGDTALGPIAVNLAYVLSILIASLVLKARGSGWREIGLARPDSWPRTLLIGIGLTVGVILVGIALRGIAQKLPGSAIRPSDQSQYNPLHGNLHLLLTMLVLSWTTIAFGEEMLFRAFLTNSLAGLFQGAKARWALALIGSSVAFGLVHYDWGLAGMVETTIMGLLLGFAYLRSGRNLWITIVAHGLLNTLKFVLVFSGAV
jgi:membrane protease YdiL (CAAX protease family)